MSNFGQRYRASTACPSCGQRHVVDVWQVLEAQAPGTYALSGTQVKVAARPAWRFECTACGALGPASPNARS